MLEYLKRKWAAVKDDLGNLGERAVKTAVQVFLAEATIAAIFGGDIVTVRKAAIAAAAAGLSVLWNAAQAWAAEGKDSE